MVYLIDLMTPVERERPSKEMPLKAGKLEALVLQRDDHPMPQSNSEWELSGPLIHTEVVFRTRPHCSMFPGLLGQRSYGVDTTRVACRYCLLSVNLCCCIVSV